MTRGARTERAALRGARSHDRRRFSERPHGATRPGRRRVRATGADAARGGTIDDVLDRVARAALEVVTGADIVSISLRRGSGLIDTPATTDPVGVRLDELQNEFDEGPCLDASRVPGSAVAGTADVAAGEEFPKWGPAAAELGIGSAMAIGLFPCRSRPGWDRSTSTPGGSAASTGWIPTSFSSSPPTPPPRSRGHWP